MSSTWTLTRISTLQRKRERIIFIKHLKILQPKIVITTDFSILHVYMHAYCHLVWRTLVLKCNKNNYACMYEKGRSICFQH
jgi:hypothetical protein